MKTSHRIPARFAAALIPGAMLLGAAPAFAINGLQLGGYGIKNASMGGASIALPLDTVAAANNPAGMAYVPAGFDLNLQTFYGTSSSNYLVPGNHLENSTTTLIPEGGFNWAVNPTVNVGLSIASQGAGADYGQPALPIPGFANADASLSIVEFIPTVAWKPMPELAFGAGLNLAYERFNAQGVLVPAPVAGGIAQLPGYGTSTATGVGLRLGMLWKATPTLAFGVNLKTRTGMSKLDGYANNLLASSNGRIDVPAQYGVGAAWNATERLTLAADYLRIEYRDIAVMQDPSGFYWRDQPVFRLGASYALDARWTLRAGASFNRGQILDSNLAQNLLAPALADRAFTVGVSFALDPASDISAGYELNPSVGASGTGLSTGTTLNSKVQMFLLGYQHRF